jgi:hypothetical protein
MKSLGLIIGIGPKWSIRETHPTPRTGFAIEVQVAGDPDARLLELSYESADELAKELALWQRARGTYT